MILANIKQDEESILEFSMDVFGTTDKVSDTRFVIEGKDFDLVCKCTVVEDGVQVKVPKLKGLLESGEHNARLEVVLNDRIFVPLNESIVVDQLVEFNVAKQNVTTVKEGVSVKVKNSTSQDSKSKNTDLDKALAEGCTVVKYGTFDILKQGEKYIGLVTESKVLKSKTQHTLLSSLIEELSK